MDSREVFLTEYDRERLMRLIAEAEATSSRDDLAGLLSELGRAHVVAPVDVPADVVTMNSRITLSDAETSEEMQVTLVFPPDADADAGCISILAPVGTAILGYRQGDTIEWPVPAGIRRLTIVRIDYQPEAAGDMTL